MPTPRQIESVLGVAIKHRVKLADATLEWLLEQRHGPVSHFVQDHHDVLSLGNALAMGCMGLDCL
jgi:hypothetical protein